MSSTSTSEELQANTLNQVYTLGLSNGLKHLSKITHQPARQPDQNASNVSVFRIYPLNRSKEKSTQTMEVVTREVTVNDKSVQCEIWGTNPSIRTKGNLSEDKRSITNSIQNIGRETSISTQHELNIERYSSGDLAVNGAKYKQNVSKGDTPFGGDKSTGMCSNVPETDGEVTTSNCRLPTSPLLEISKNCPDNIDQIVNNDETLSEVTKDLEKVSSHVVQAACKCTEPKIIEKPFTQSTANHQCKDPVTANNVPSFEIAATDSIKNLYDMEPASILDVNIQITNMIEKEQNSVQIEIQKDFSSLKSFMETDTLKNEATSLVQSITPTDQTDKNVTCNDESKQNGSPNYVKDETTTINGDTKKFIGEINTE